MKTGAIKSIPKADVEKLIRETELHIAKANQIFMGSDFGAPSRAFGYAESILEGMVKKLKGDYPI